MFKLLCVYHADCADGFGAAWAVHRRFGGVEFVAAKYGDAPPNIVNRDVMIVDFSYPLATLQAMATEARSVLVIDHHKTARADLYGLVAPNQTFEAWRRDGQNPLVGSNLAAIFDMERSGAGLTWDYLHPGRTRPRIIDLVEDRDLWRFNHDPDTRQFHAVAASYGYSMTEKTCGMQNALVFWDILDQWASAPETPASGGLWWSLLREGAAIIRAQQKLVEDTVRGTRRAMRISGFEVPVACCPAVLASDAGHVLCQGHAFSATYYDGTDNLRHFELRSSWERSLKR